jgi:hypothetical protein
MAASGEETMAGVPPIGLPKITSFVSLRDDPNRSASPLWSMTTNSALQQFQLPPIDGRRSHPPIVNFSCGRSLPRAARQWALRNRS